jgi:hypothetical protein
MAYPRSRDTLIFLPPDRVYCCLTASLSGRTRDERVVAWDRVVRESFRIRTGRAGRSGVSLLRWSDVPGVVPPPGSAEDGRHTAASRIGRPVKQVVPAACSTDPKTPIAWRGSVLTLRGTTPLRGRSLAMPLIPPSGRLPLSPGGPKADGYVRSPKITDAAPPGRSRPARRPPAPSPRPSFAPAAFRAARTPARCGSASHNRA